MFDIVTFGSATLDTFLKLGEKDYKIIEEKEFPKGKGVCFSLGSKVKVNDIVVATGGGGTNTAVTFSHQGFKTSFYGKIGDDLAGKRILRELKELDIDTSYVLRTEVKPTNISVILTPERKDRTILVYRGASELFCESDISWEKLKAKWFYLAPFSGEFCNISGNIIDFAKENKIKVAFNPSKEQINLPEPEIEKMIEKVDVLVLNQEEASQLTEISFEEENKIFQKIDKMCPGIAIMTKGKNGVVVSDGKNLWLAESPKVELVDRTGAGDSFGSGFVAGLIKSEGNIEKAIQLGIANATSCLKEWGAKNGLLKKGEEFEKVKIRKKLSFKKNEA